MRHDTDALRRKLLAQADEARRSLDDERYDWVRPLGRRRALVVAGAALVLGYAVGVFAGWPVLTLVALVAYIGVLFLLRMAVRAITDLPDELVDERMRQVRGEVYRHAYVGTMGLVSVGIAVFIVNQITTKLGWTGTMTGEQMHELMFVIFFFAMGLPSALYAWQEREI